MVQCDRDCILYNLTGPLFSDIPKDDVDFQVTNPAGQVAVRTIVEAC